MILRAMPAVALATGRVTLAGQVEGDGPNEKGYPGLPGWVLGLRLTTSPGKTPICYKTLQCNNGGQGPPWAVTPLKKKKVSTI
jgi:hypothetical protein